MTATTFSIAMTAATATSLREHLFRSDGQEDLCLATYATSTGATRTTAIIRTILLPRPNETTVHGNVSFTGSYVFRAAQEAASEGHGVAILHSHPKGHDWQLLSPPDADAESSYSHLVSEITGHPLVGMTLAGGDGTWSGRRWDAPASTPARSVRVVGPILEVSFNERLMPAPVRLAQQIRTVSAWGGVVQDNITRMRVLVVGAGSVGLDVASRLAAVGIRHVAVMDFDRVKVHNRDRLIGATPLDAAARRLKIDVAHRQMRLASTADRSDLMTWEQDITTPEGQRIALDYDVIFSCVDRPFPRAVLNQVAYADLIPVIDGGIAIDNLPDERMRNATWRSHVVQPGYGCLYCIGQIDPTDVARDREGTLDDPSYLGAARHSGKLARQNVAALSASVSASMLTVFTCMIAAPGGLGAPGPLRYSLSNHHQDMAPIEPSPYCQVESRWGVADRRVPLTKEHWQDSFRPDIAQRVLGWSGEVLDLVQDRLQRLAARRLRRDPSP